MTWLWAGPASMAWVLAVLNTLVGAGLGAALLFFGWVSLAEEELRAARLAFVLALWLPLPYLLVGLTRFPLQPLLAAGVLLATGLAALLLLLPIASPPLEDDTPQARVDERDVMFARWRLVPGSPEYRAYYARRPGNQEADERFRAEPGLMSPQARMYHPLAFSAAEASFDLIEALHPQVSGPVGERPAQASPAEMTRFIKGMARYHGAHSVGVTELWDYHVYSHVGRGQGEYGAPVELAHRYAIALTVEMSYAMMRRAPAAPTMMETAKQYLEVGKIALGLGHLIRALGYPARAHVDGNYQVICPLVARDAGLGEIGRMGLLMTPDLGPRVRISVVTTDLPLIPDRPARDPSLIDFCRRCLKCAENCPSRSIPFGDRELIDGVKRWKLNSDTCFLYWNRVGTDCGRCVIVCPYAHPNNRLHNLVRWGIRRSPLVRRLALFMDDLFYGRNPKPARPPDWLALGGGPKNLTGA